MPRERQNIPRVRDLNPKAAAVCGINFARCYVNEDVISKHILHMFKLKHSCW